MIKEAIGYVNKIVKLTEGITLSEEESEINGTNSSQASTHLPDTFLINSVSDDFKSGND